jgi:hypothetical protein
MNVRDFPRAAARSSSSMKSARRAPSSHLLNHVCGRPTFAATWIWVSPASRRTRRGRSWNAWYRLADRRLTLLTVRRSSNLGAFFLWVSCARRRDDGVVAARRNRRTSERETWCVTEATRTEAIPRSISARYAAA